MTYREVLRETPFVGDYIKHLRGGSWSDYESAKKYLLPLIPTDGHDAVIRKMINTMKL